MASDKQRLNTLLIQLENLLLRQQSFESEIVKLKQEVRQLQTGEIASADEVITQPVAPEIAPIEPEFVSRCCHRC